MPAAIGTIITKFNNTFILTDPQYITGLELYRQVLTPPQAEDIHGIGGVLPIVTTNDTFNDKINVSFNIAGLDAIANASGTKTPKALAFGMLQNGLSTSPQAPKINQVVAIAPIQSVSQQGVDVLYFDIGVLPQESITEPADIERKYNIALKDYNVNSSVQITSDLPMVDEVNGDVATFSFDITDLNYV